jgi:hypothetical protein
MLKSRPNIIPHVTKVVFERHNTCGTRGKISGKTRDVANI